MGGGPLTGFSAAFKLHTALHNYDSLLKNFGASSCSDFAKDVDCFRQGGLATVKRLGSRAICHAIPGFDASGLLAMPLTAKWQRGESAVSAVLLARGFQEKALQRLPHAAEAPFAKCMLSKQFSGPTLELYAQPASSSCCCV